MPKTAGKKATAADADIVMKLYDLRREAEMRKARNWYGNADFSSWDAVQKVAMAWGTPENAWFRQVLTYWENAASLVLRGVVNRDLAGLAELATELVGVVEDLRAGDDRHPLVEEPHQEARHARLGLAALAQEDDVLPREDGVFDLRQNGVLVADDAGEELRAGLEPLDEVVAELLLDRF